MSTGRRCVGVVLTGGASTRMGADKAFVLVGGRPMAVRVADALWEAGCHPVECQGGDLDALHALGLEAHPDTSPSGGPVPAIQDALDRAGGPIVVAACDLADLDAATVEALLAAGHDGGRVVVAEAGDRRHLVSYWGAGSAELLAAARSDGATSYLDALERVGAVGVEVDAAAVRNVNRPDDLR